MRVAQLPAESAKRRLAGSLNSYLLNAKSLVQNFVKSDYWSGDCKIKRDTPPTAAKCGKKSSAWRRKKPPSLRDARVQEKTRHSARRGVNPEGRRHSSTYLHWSIGARQWSPSLPWCLLSTRRLKTSSTHRIIAFARKGLNPTSFSNLRTIRSM